MKIFVEKNLNLTNLISLDLEYNNLSGIIPSEIGNLVNLSYLNLGQNQLNGIVPEEICNIVDDGINVRSNNLCEPFPECVEAGTGNNCIP